MDSLEELYAAIRILPVQERLRLVERVVHDLAEPPSPEAVEIRFQSLAEQWRSDCLYLSSSPEREEHPAYQKIIGLGAAVVPLLLREMERGPSPWHRALVAITGEDPRPPGSEGKKDVIALAWVSWGRQRGLLR